MKVVMGWVAGAFVILGMWLVADKSIWGFVSGTLGNALWAYLGLKRGKQYDLAAIALLMTVINIIGLIKWLG